MGDYRDAKPPCTSVLSSREQGAGLNHLTPGGHGCAQIADMVRTMNGETIAQCLESLDVENDTLCACQSMVDEWRHIKRCWFRMAKESHPDKGGDPADFRAAQASAQPHPRKNRIGPLRAARCTRHRMGRTNQPAVVHVTHCTRFSLLCADPRALPHPVSRPTL